MYETEQSNGRCFRHTNIIPVYYVCVCVWFFLFVPWQVRQSTVLTQHSDLQLNVVTINGSTLTTPHRIASPSIAYARK